MAYGSIVDGVFDGKIHSKDGVYYVEKASKYFPRSESSSGSANDGDRFHSIIYREAHVIDPYDEHRTGTMGEQLARTTAIPVQLSPLLKIGWRVSMRIKMDDIRCAKLSD